MPDTSSEQGNIVGRQHEIQADSAVKKGKKDRDFQPVVCAGRDAHSSYKVWKYSTIQLNEQYIQYK